MADIYSYKDFTGWEFISRPEYTFKSGITIDRANFSQETPDRHIFPETMSGVTFSNCNLDNCYIPPGNTVKGGSQRRFAIQKDLRDWNIDGSNNPTTLVSEPFWVQLKTSIDPVDIPATKIVVAANQSLLEAIIAAVPEKAK